MSDAGKIPGLYIHVPFCRSKCPYCDFYSTVESTLIPGWLKAVCQEADSYRDFAPVFDSLYLGGGTPSVLNCRQISLLLKHLSACFRFAPDTEITLEANPDDLTRTKLQALRQAGFNRLSIGVQSFSDPELAWLGRRYDGRQAEKAIASARNCGFANLGLDLLYGLENQTEDGWLKTLNKAIGFQPEHLACYQLTLKKNTPFRARYRRGKIRLPNEAEQKRFFLLTSQYLSERGYIHYEISNFAAGKKYFSRHNRKYWRHIPYLGLGPAGHSFQANQRWWNYADTNKYIRALKQGIKPVEQMEELSEEQLRLEKIYLGLRTREGIPKKLVRQNPETGKIMQNLQKSGLVAIRRNRIIPTVQGFLLADVLPEMLV